MKYKNVYFINGNAYAGKSTMVKLLSNKFNGILCEENYHNILLDELDKEEFPALTYSRDLKDFREFIRRTPEEYERWIVDVTKECEILELKILDELVKKNELIFVDTNISLETLSKISDKDHVLIMLTDPNVAVDNFFNRPDKEKQYLYHLLKTEEDSEIAMENFRNCLKKINNFNNYHKFLNYGFNVLLKDEKRSIDETFEIVKKLFKL